MGQTNVKNLGNGGTMDGDVTITGDLTVSGGIGLSLSEVIQGTSTIDVTNTEAFLVRKNSDGGDVFTVDTTNSAVEVGGHLTLPDASGSGGVLKLGASEDIQIYHDGSNSYFDHLNTGDLKIRSLMHGGDIVFHTEASDGTQSTSALVIDSSGKVGIGHSNPQDTLSLSSSSGAGLNIIRADSAITSGERIGHISFVGTENSHSNFGYGARIEALATEAWTEGSAEGTKLVFYTTDNSSATLDARMTIDHNGNVGIGEASPLGKLHIFTGDSTFEGGADSSADELVIEGSGDTGLSILSPAGNKGGIYFSRNGQGTSGQINYHHVNDSPSNSMVFKTAATTAMTIDANQNVGIGCTPEQQLSVAANSGGGHPRIGILNHVGDSEGGTLYFRKSRNTTVGSHTVVQDGDEIGVINFSGSDGNSFEAFAAIKCKVDGTPGNSDTPGRLEFYTVDNGTNTLGDARMTIDNAGNIGIGGTPSDLLHLSASVPIIRLTDTDTNDYHRIYGSNGGLYFDADKGDSVGSSVMGFGVDDVREMTIVAGGNIGIGTGSPTVKLSVASTVDTPLQAEHTDGAEVFISLKNNAGTAYIGSSTNDIKFNTTAAGTERMRLDSSGNLLIGHTASVAQEIDGGGHTPNLQINQEGNGGLAITQWNTSNARTSSPKIWLAKNGGATVGTHASIASGEVLGTIFFSGSDGSDFVNAASIHAIADSSVGSNDMPGALIFSTTPDGDDDVDERMRITNAGRVGIGTAAPASSLHIVGGNLLIADGEADDAIKQGRIGSEHYDVDEEPFYYLYSIIQNGNNQINIGGGTSSGNAANLIKFYTAANSTTTSGTSVMTLDSNSRISLSNNDAGTDNTVFGFQAGAALASGSVENTLIGDYAGTAVSTGDYNTAVGKNALMSETLGRGAVALGYAALAAQESGSAVNSMNVGVGNNSGAYNITGTHNTYIGADAGQGVSNNNNSSNTGIGANALRAVTTGGENVSVGKDSMYDANTATGVTAVGVESAYNITSGSESVAIGKQALYTATTVGANTAVGYQALKLNTVAGNTAVGHSALLNNSSGTGNVAVGTSAGTAITTGGYSTFIGYNAGLVHTTGGYNMAIGYGAMDDTNAGSNSLGSTENIFIGVDSGGGTWADTSSSYNVGIGNYVMDDALDGASYNTAVGQNSMSALTTGDYNTALGRASAHSLTTGTQNVLLGYGAVTSAVSGQNQIVIGYEATGQANNSVTLGNASVTAVYMAQDSGATVNALQYHADHSSLSLSGSFTGIGGNWIKTGGGTTTSHHFKACEAKITFNDADEEFGNLLGAGFYATCTTNNGTNGGDNIIGLESQGKISAGNANNVFGLASYADVDGGTIDSQVYAAYIVADCDGGTVTDTIHGIEVNVDVENVNVDGNIMGVKFVMDDDSNSGSGCDGAAVQADFWSYTNVDYHWRSYDGVGSTYAARLSRAGQIDAEGTINQSQSLDYAEYFESKDGKPIAV